MSKVKELQRKLKEVNKVVSELSNQLNEAYRNTFFTCKNCKKKSKLKTITLVREHWYDD